MMATLKRPLARDTIGQPSSISSPTSLEPIETNTKRMKRNSNNNVEESDNQSMRTISYHHHSHHLHLDTAIYHQEPPKHPEDQDDETLIRETQAALKSLSGGWSNATHYKVNEPEPAFQNLFEETKPPDGKIIITKPEYASPLYKNDNNSYYKDPTLKSSQPRVKEERRHTKMISQYPTHDFTELVEDSMNDMDQPKQDTNVYSDYPQSHRTMFSEASAFRPLGKIPNLHTSIHLPHHPASSAIDPAAYGIYQETEAPDLLDHPELVGSADQETRHNEMVRKYIKEEEERQRRKAIGSPDSKHYTILQPAGVGSMAATVMEGAARDGVVSVSAVTSTSSPELGHIRMQPANSDMGGLVAVERDVLGMCEMPPAVPEFSPGSINRGEGIFKETLISSIHVFGWAET